MGRRPRTQKHSQEKGQLNARIDEQLLIRFNEYAIKHNEGRDDLVEFAIRRLLATGRKPAHRATRHHTPLPSDVDGALTAIDDVRAVRSALSSIRRQALQLVEATAAATRRK
jgi:hypothetical protein